jgi:two-component system, chemotaxis family, CheB/CheR fusion protein
MNAELQSANNELHTSNEQLRDRTIEISDLNAFMESILGSLEAAIIVLDRDFMVQVWTRQAHELWVCALTKRSDSTC